MQKYKIVFDMLENKKKQTEIVKETGFTIDVVKKVSQLKKIYSKIEEQIKDKLLLDRLYSLKFKAIELKKIADAKELLEEFLESSYTGMKTSEIKLKVNELVSRKERLGIAKDEYLSKKQKLEEDELRIKELIKVLEDKETEQEEQYPFLKGKSKEVKSYLIILIGLYLDEYVLRHRVSIDIKKGSLPLKYNHSYKVWYITDLDKFVEVIESRIHNNESVLWEESECFEYRKTYWDGYKDLSKESGPYKMPNGLQTLGIPGIKNKILNYKSELKEIRKELKEIRKNTSNNFKEDTLFADSISTSEIAEHRLVQDIFLKEYFKEGYTAAAEVTIGNKRFDTALYKPSKLIVGEVKASRSDFISDKKYLTYKEYCNELYMVLSNKVTIKDEEVLRLKNEGVGLFIVNTTTGEVKKVHSSLAREISTAVKHEVLIKMIKTLKEKVGEKY